MLSTSELVKKYGLDARKCLGQNFILDKNITDKIAKSVEDISSFEVLEIGAGPGGLSRSILDAGAKKLTIIEKDARFIEPLQELKNIYKERLNIINADALKIDEMEIFSHCNKIKIVANLPYNIGTQLLFKWLKIANKISSMHLMLQKEVVDRIVAKPNSKHFGRLSVMTNYIANTKMLFTVDKNVFVPPPKVTSAIVRLIPKENIEYNYKLETLIAAAFSQRRKMIKSCLKTFFVPNNINDILQQCNIDGALRAENLTIEDFCKLSEFS